MLLSVVAQQTASWNACSIRHRDSCYRPASLTVRREGLCICASVCVCVGVCVCMGVCVRVCMHAFLTGSVWQSIEYVKNNQIKLCWNLIYSRNKAILKHPDETNVIPPVGGASRTETSRQKVPLIRKEII